MNLWISHRLPPGLWTARRVSKNVCRAPMVAPLRGPRCPWATVGPSRTVGTSSVAKVPAADVFTRLFPAPDSPGGGSLIDDLFAAVAAEDRPPFEDRPWVYSNMVTSLDGATAVDGVSAALGGPADQAMFGAIRAIADVIVVGSGTAIEEDYRPPSDRFAEVRTGRGQQPRPTVVVLSRSLSIEPDHRLFSEPAARPIVATVREAPSDRRQALAPVADLIDVGSTDLDLRALLRELHRRGARRALLEGGPTVNGQFLSAGLVDEWNLTLSPLLAAGDSARPAHGPQAVTQLSLDRLWTCDGLLFGRWLSRR